MTMKKTIQILKFIGKGYAAKSWKEIKDHFGWNEQEAQHWWDTLIEPRTYVIERHERRGGTQGTVQVFRLSIEGQRLIQEQSKRQKVGKPKRRSSEKFDIFLSHSHKNWKVANELKDELEWRFGLRVFLAHKDIEPSKEWVSTILHKLEECRIFIPLLTRHFKSSNWTDQETGIAISKGKIVIPIKVDLLPYGFINKYQALNWDRNNIENNIKRLVQILLTEGEITVGQLVESFAKSGSFTDAALKSELLNEVKLNRSQIYSVAKASLQNFQIINSNKARPNLRELFSRNWKLLDRPLRTKVNRIYDVT